MIRSQRERIYCVTKKLSMICRFNSNGRWFLTNFSFTFSLKYILKIERLGGFNWVAVTVEASGVEAFSSFLLLSMCFSVKRSSFMTLLFPFPFNTTHWFCRRFVIANFPHFWANVLIAWLLNAQSNICTSLALIVSFGSFCWHGALSSPGRLVGRVTEVGSFDMGLHICLMGF